MPRKTLDDVFDEMRSVARGERRAAPLPTPQALAALTEEAFQLLGILATRAPATVGELAALTNRAQPNVSRSLQLLARAGVVRLTKVGREVRPELLARRITIDLATGRLEPAVAAA